MAKAVVLFKMDDEYKKRLAAALPGTEIVYQEDAVFGTARIDAAHKRDVEIIFGNPAASEIAECPALKWMQLQSAGTDAYIKLLAGSNIILTNASGAYGHAIAEHMIALVFSLYKRLHQYRDEQIKGTWNPRGGVRSIKGSVVLSVGMGDIGGQFAERMKAMGAYIIGVRRTATREKPAFADEVHTTDKLDSLLPRADIVALSLPGTSGSQGLFNRERLSRMKDRAVLINIGRGSAVDQDALCDLLDSKKLLGAALDVTDPEPLPAGHRLWKTENVIITPHVSGGFFMRETYENIVEICLDNAARYKAGKPLCNIVDFETGYRS